MNEIKKTIGAMDLISQAWHLYRKNFDTFLPPMVILALFAVLGVAIDTLQYPFKPTIDVIVMVLLLLASIWLNVVFIKITDKVLSGEKVDINLIYKESYARSPRYFWVEVVYTLIVLGGSILLIVPGLIFATWFFFSRVIVILGDRSKKINEILTESKELFRGRFGNTLWRLIAPQLFFSFILMVISFGIAGIITGGQMDIAELSQNAYVSLLLSLVSALLTPLMTLPIVSLYRELKKS